MMLPRSWVPLPLNSAHEGTYPVTLPLPAVDGREGVILIVIDWTNIYVPLRYDLMLDNLDIIVTEPARERRSITVGEMPPFVDVWQIMLINTPLAPYFSECITSEYLDDMNIEIMRNTLYKAYL
ncbi:V-type proton ATPase subunit D2 [Tanacetum coccineum]